MKGKYQNGFLLFGTTVLILMVAQLDFNEVWNGLCHAGYWSAAVVVLWAFLYIFNTATWYIIINSEGKTKVRFWWLYKITVSESQKVKIPLICHLAIITCNTRGYRYFYCCTGRYTLIFRLLQV